MAGGSGKRPSLRSGLGMRFARDFYLCHGRDLQGTGLDMRE